MIVFGCLFLRSVEGYSQVLLDGPMELTIRLKKVYVGFNETDAPILGQSYAPDEIKFRVWAKASYDSEGYGWVGGSLHEFSMGTGATHSLPGYTPNIDDTLFYHNYTTSEVPEFIDLKLYAWEDDLPSDNLLGNCMDGLTSSFDDVRCCGQLLFGSCVGMQEGDDKKCDNLYFAQQVFYRTVPPNAWHNLGDIEGSCNQWKLNIEVYWTSSNTTNISEVNASSFAIVYPNPSSDKWNLTVGDGWIGSTLEVLDITGRVIYASEVKQPLSVLPVEAAEGVYQLQLRSHINQTKSIRVFHW